MTSPFVVVIPSRYGSTRLPGKPLIDLEGMPMIERVYRQAIQSGAADVFVATDDSRITTALAPVTDQIVMTAADHSSGTDRLAEVADKLELEDEAIVVNVQGDEPLIPPAVIDQVAGLLDRAPTCSVATLCEVITDWHEFLQPSAVKVVLDEYDRALLFSRAPVPYPRDSLAKGLPLAKGLLPLAKGLPVAEQELSADFDHTAYRHIGLYAYRAGALRRFTQWGMTPAERIESLEQLRFMEKGEQIKVGIACEPVPGGVDTAADLDAVRAILRGLK